jgi:hypothetical protein
VRKEGGGKRCRSGFSLGGSIRTAYSSNLPCYISWLRLGIFFLV